MLNPEKIIEILNLEPLDIEGGFYRETYRSDERIPRESLPGRYGSSKAFSTAIFYMLAPETKSTMHRLKSDEIFHFYLGDPVEMLLLYPEGNGETRLLGHNIRGQKLKSDRVS